ncbi:MAG: hypothetical protein AMS26_11820 [Bacteroides sp. SM23_62]|nr:MAG: hypothetical protein AMS26_11820 [Bacteroides sp. SM23_62]
MGSNPINLAVRFLLEISALLTMGIWGWRQSETWLRFDLTFGIPVMAALIWGLFAVPDDPSRSGSVPIPVPGIIRLVMEIAFFVSVIWILYHLHYVRLSWILGLTVTIHYAISYDRVLWLIRH